MGSTGKKVLSGIGRLLRGALALALAAGVTLLLFLILPFMEQVGKKPEADLELHSLSTGELPPPPPPPPEEKPEEPEEEKPPPPELNEQAVPLDLSQLEVALNPGFGDGMGGGDFAVKLAAVEQKAAEESDAIFSVGDLDQAPRAVFQPSPAYPPELKKRKIEGTVHLVFLVDSDGRVVNPIVQKSANPAFDQPALQAVRKWRFEPGRRGGKPVSFKMKVPITFANR